jgi:hypothetical protein
VQLLFGHLVGAGKQRRREVEPEVSRRRKIDDELEFGRLLDRQIAGLCSVRDLDQNVHHPFRHLFETRKGEVITSKDEYFVTAPRFTTASKKYEWIDSVSPKELMEVGNALRRTRSWQRTKSANGGYERVGLPDDAMADCPF